MKRSKTKKPHKVLDGYKKVGSKFIPPMMQMGVISFTSYSRQTMPELIWWDVVAIELSSHFAATLAESIGSFFKSRNETNCWWAFISDYSKLSDQEFNALKLHLNSAGLLDPLVRALDPFLNLYPACPLSRFLPSKPIGAVDLRYLVEFESRMKKLEYKRSREAVLMQAQAIYMGFILEKLFIKKGLALADFPEVEKYPDTERSKEVGASICASVNMMSGNMLPAYADNKWVLYFWMRGAELRPISFEHLSEL